jgi:hypothetical protein
MEGSPRVASRERRLARPLRRHARLTGLLLVVQLLAAALPASAAPQLRERIYETYEFEFDWCGFPVHGEGEQAVNVTVNQRGRDGLPYLVATIRGETRWTNAEVEDGPVFSVDFAYTDRDQRVTDNGDGTSTLVVTLSGREVYELDGARLFMNTGLRQFSILVDNGGTPTDWSDDEFLEDLEFLKFAGREGAEGRDFCDDLNEFLNS